MSGPLFWIFVLFVAQFLAVNLISFALLAISVASGRRRAREARVADFDAIAHSPLSVPVSVVIPAFNEELGLVDTVHSVLASVHPELEVVVVNDGSTDGMLERARAEFALEPHEVFYPQPLETRTVRRVYRSARFPNLWVLDKENGGKADACNAGINFARFRYVLLTDGDCVFHPEALLRVTRVLNEDPGRIVAVGGQVRVLNGMRVRDGRIVARGLPRHLVSCFQVVEYIGAFLGNRLGWSTLNGIPVLSGAFSVWRRDVLVEHGGMSRETTHEDIEMTLRVHASFRRRRVPYRIVSLPDPIVYTEVPFRWGDLYRQRKRWQRVVYEVCWLHRRTWFNPRYGVFGALTMPYLLLYEALGPFVEAGAWLFVALLALLGSLDADLLLFLAVSCGLTAIARTLALFVDLYFFESYPLRFLLTLSLLAFLEQLVYRPVTVVARMMAFGEFLAGHKSWHRVERRGAAG
jgi:cellulose synthase/poly-beta-1,6-N-acetylglucosamine synthase-like glycosyltransferase